MLFRSCEGATHLDIVRDVQDAVSIRAPAKERRRRHARSARRSSVSIRAPAKERPVETWGEVWRVLFRSALLRRSDNRYGMPPKIMFRFRSALLRRSDGRDVGHCGRSVNRGLCANLVDPRAPERPASGRRADSVAFPWRCMRATRRRERCALGVRAPSATAGARRLPVAAAGSRKAAGESGTRCRRRRAGGVQRACASSRLLAAPDLGPGPRM